MRPVLTVLTVIIALWYAACLPMNLREVLTEAERAGAVIVPAAAVDRIDAATIPLILNNISALGGSWSQDRPRLPAPHQIGQALWDSTVAEALFNRKGEFSNRNLLYHAGTTLFPTLLGFVIGTLLGILLAVGIVHSRAMDMSVMPWAIISQTIPIVALAPDDHCRAECGGDTGAAAQGDHFRLSVVLSGRGRHGQGAAVARSDATGPVAHL